MSAVRILSLPHGSADRNRLTAPNPIWWGGRSLTGARIETGTWATDNTRALVAPSRERGSKQGGNAAPERRRDVAPSRERGSKLPNILRPDVVHGSLPHGSADRNRTYEDACVFYGCRSLTGARIETTMPARSCRGSAVAPSRERGSKQRSPHARRRRPCRSLTGARIETWRSRPPRCRPAVAPSRERGSKHGRGRPRRDDLVVAPSRERGSKLRPQSAPGIDGRSLPHGSADRNSIPASS